MSDPALRQEAGALVARAGAGQRAFDNAMPAAERAAAQAGASGSESWIAAQQAISRLEAARAQTVEALALLDRLAVQRSALPTNPDDFRTIVDAAEKAGALATAQQDAIDRLRARIAP
ncbi:hypothetical protein IC614_01845 [Allosphingosinicella flava]|uniref:Uncharacterized protein n=1 Tax=Allosphingosinicella flava TaxID=2771430 RepID=A0A7T2GK69_9SPHN|nr:hypothetical protein [Sphingosinicella flava]QPQ55378.1 hypothetical protein IC614_01845 [Sphingosinicella flava]